MRMEIGSFNALLAAYIHLTSSHSLMHWSCSIPIPRCPTPHTPVPKLHRLIDTSICINSKLNFIVQQSNFLPRLECRQPDVWTAIAPECVTQRTIATRADLALDCEVDFREIVRAELRKIGICVRSLRLVLCFDSLSQPASAILAGSPPLGVGFARFS